MSGSMMFECSGCYYQGLPLLVMKEYKGKNAGNFYLRAECPDCHRYVKIVKQTPVWLTLYNKQKK